MCATIWPLAVAGVGPETILWPAWWRRSEHLGGQLRRQVVQESLVVRAEVIQLAGKLVGKCLLVGHEAVDLAVRSDVEAHDQAVVVDALGVNDARSSTTPGHMSTRRCQSKRT